MSNDRATGSIPATGNELHVPWVIFTRFENGTVVEDSELWDDKSRMKQIGVIPEDGQT